MSEATPDPIHVLRGRKGAHMKWANTDDRSAATAPARAGFYQKFLDEAGGDPVRAEHLRKAWYAGLSLKSAQARRKSAEFTAVAEQAEAELEAGGPDAA